MLSENLDLRRKIFGEHFAVWRFSVPTYGRKCSLREIRWNFYKSSISRKAFCGRERTAPTVLFLSLNMEAVYQNNQWSRGCSLNSPSHAISHIFREDFRFWPRTRAVRPDPSHIWNQSIDNFRRDDFIWFWGILRDRTTKLLVIKST